MGDSGNVSLDFRDGVENALHLAGVALELVVELGGLFTHHFFDMRDEGIGRQAERVRRLGAVRSTVAPALRAIFSMAVFSLRAWMNSVCTPRLRACSTECSNRRARAASAHFAGHRHAELGHRWLRIGRGVRMGQMRHRDQFQAAVEDAEHFVLVEIERVDASGRSAHPWPDSRNAG